MGTIGVVVLGATGGPVLIVTDWGLVIGVLVVDDEVFGAGVDGVVEDGFVEVGVVEEVDVTGTATTFTFWVVLAGAYSPLPPWLAVTLQVPAPVKETTPLEMLQTFPGETAKLTVRPELLFATGV